MVTALNDLSASFTSFLSNYFGLLQRKNNMLDKQGL
jgi:hypothetical protein